MQCITPTPIEPRAEEGGPKSANTQTVMMSPEEIVRELWTRNRQSTFVTATAAAVLKLTSEAVEPVLADLLSKGIVGVVGETDDGREQFAFLVPPQMASPQAVTPPASTRGKPQGARVVAPAPPRATVRTLSTVQPTSVQWLVEKLIPLGKVTVMDGDPGEGKSLVTMDLGARLTTGRALLPELPASGPEKVLFIVCEDGVGDTLRPRAEAAGADLTKLDVLRTIRVGSNDSPFELPIHREVLRKLIEDKKYRLVVIDPLTAYIDGKLNTFRDSDVRKVMAPLSEIAEDTGAAIICVRHLNKNSEQSALHRGGGSVAFVGAARSALLVGPHPTAGEDDRVIARTKTNLAKRETASLHFRVIERNGIPAVEWVGWCQVTAEDILRAKSGKKDEPRPGSKLAAAVKLLTDTLSAGPAYASDLYARGETEGISDETLKRARRHVKAIAFQEHGNSGRWMWSLPEEGDSPAAPPNTGQV